MNLALPLSRIATRAVPAALVATLAAAIWPSVALGMLGFIAASLLAVLPLVALGVLLSAWVAASGAGAVTARLVRGRPLPVILLASGIGAVTPVCGVTVLPLATGLLAAGIPLAPIMAFWVSSPVTDPALFTATWAVLGPAYAVGKTAAAFGIGVFAGLVTAAIAGADFVRRPLRRGARTAPAGCEATCPDGFSAGIWRDAGRVRIFRAELLAMTRLVLICLTLAFGAEYLIRDLVPPDLLAAHVGPDSPYGIPLAVAIGGPMYLDGYAALPLMRALLDLGMSDGAAMAFLVAGSAFSIYGVLAVAMVLRVPTLVLFVGLAAAGTLLSAYGFEAVLKLLA